jgi:hypothetical protein
MKYWVLIFLLLIAPRVKAWDGLKVKSKLIRPLEVRVLDAETQKPLSNVVVYYELTSAGPRSFFGIPIADPVYDRSVRQECFMTDHNGRVSISAYKARLKLYESIIVETVTVNLDVKQDEGWKRKRDFFSQLSSLIIQLPNKIVTPLAVYKGVVIMNFPGQLLLEEAAEYVSDIYVEKRISGGLDSEQQVLKIEVPKKPIDEVENRLGEQGQSGEGASDEFQN